MRKMPFLLLVICLTLAFAPACAEDVQLLTVGSFAFEVPTSWEIEHVSEESGMAGAVLVPQHAETVYIFTIDYTAFPEWLQKMEMECKDHTEKVAFHMAVVWNFWDVLDGDLEELTAILNGQYEGGFWRVIDDDRGIIVAILSSETTGYRKKVSTFQMVENTGFVIVEEAKMLADETQMVHLSAKPVAGSTDETTSGSAAVEGASDKAAYVVITADSGKIRTEASISAGLIKTAYKGETFELIRAEGDWYIVDVNGRTGYIHKGVSAIQ